MKSSFAAKILIQLIVFSFVVFAKPQDVMADTGYLRVSPSTCTVANGGDVRCWGIGIGDKASEMGNALIQSRLNEPVQTIAHRNSWSVSDRYCAIANTSGSLWCWEHGDPADGASFSTPLRVELPAEFLPKGVSMGAGHVCAIATDGVVRCWTTEPYVAKMGMVGPLQGCNTGSEPLCNVIDEAGISSTDANTLSLGEDRFATQIATGAYFTCVLLDDGTVKCFGNNDYGQLGQGDTDPRGLIEGTYGDDLPPIDFGTDADVVQITAGESHACARFDDGKVRCWGLNNAGQIGLGTSEGEIGDEDTDVGDFFPTVSLGTGLTAKRVYATGQSTCVITSNNLLKCWGLNDEGQLGIGSASNYGDRRGETPNKLTGVSLGTGRTARAVDMYWNHICADLDNGQLKCWGSGRHGQLGIGSKKTVGDSAREMGDYLPVVNLGNQIPEIVVNPSIAGTLKVGSTITAKVGTWSASPAAKYAYAWFACTASQTAQSEVDVGCVQLAGKTSTTLKLTSSHRGKYILVRITATNVEGVTVRTSRTYGPTK